MSDDQQPQKTDSESTESTSLELVDKLLRGDITDHEAAELKSRMEESPQLRAEYLRQAVIHSKLLWSHGKAVSSPKTVDPIAIAELIHEAERAARLEAMQEVAELSVEPSSCDEVEPQSKVPVRGLIWFAGGALAAAILLALMVPSPPQPPPVVQRVISKPSEQLPQPSPLPEPPLQPVLQPVVAKLYKSREAVWEKRKLDEDGTDVFEKASLPHGTSFRKRDRYHLLAGYAYLTTLAGASISIESPCEIEFVGTNHVELHEGKLIGECITEESRGFTVDTSTRRIVDLGTQFGVWVDEQGSLFAEVFEGKVAASEITADGEATNRRDLVQEQVLAVDKTGRESPVKRSLDNSPFNQLAGAGMGIVEHSDDIVFLSYPPREIEDSSLSSEKGVFVIEELRSGFQLPDDLNVTIQSPGTYDGGFLRVDGAPKVLKDRVIRSYLIHVDCSQRSFQSRQAKLTFDGELLGVIANLRHWEEFVAMVPDEVCRLNVAQGKDLLEAKEEIKEEERHLRDSIHLGDDGRSIEVSFTVAPSAFDTIRVIVSMPTEQ